jgi:hypothetical protein
LATVNPARAAGRPSAPDSLLVRRAWSRMPSTDTLALAALAALAIATAVALLALLYTST